MVRNWKPVCSLVGDTLSGAEFAPFRLWLAPACSLCLVEDAISGAEIAPRLLVLSVADLPLCLQQGEELV